MTKWNHANIAPLLWINIALGTFVLLAHGGFILLVRAGKAPQYADDLGMAYVTSAIALLIVATAIAALFKAPLRMPILKVQSVILVIAAIAMILYGATVALAGIPPGKNFVWNPVLFAFVVAYPIFLVQRAFARAAPSPVALQAPLWAAAISVVISAVIMWRISSVAT